MNRKAVAIVLVLAFLLAGCRGNSIGAENPSASAEHSSTSSQTQTPERSAPVAEEETVVLGMEDLQKYTALFDSLEFNGFLSESFHGPEDIEWEEVFRNGAGITAENVSGQEIEDYLRENGLPHTEDASNADESLRRNRLRHRVLPLLREMKKKLDPSTVGGAPMLGLNGVVIKAHGNSKGPAFASAIEQCIAYLENNVNGEITEMIAAKKAQESAEAAQEAKE